MENISRNNIPRHLAIIMDGNGRWAERRGLSRNEGHRAGMKKVEEILEACIDLGVKVLTLYAFSSQNWKRPRREVNFLIKEFERYIDEEMDKLNKKSVQFRVIGRIRVLSPKLQEKIAKAMKRTKNNQKLVLNLAINYGGQEEILDTAKELIRKVKDKVFSLGDIDINLFRKYLYTKGLPYPDLLIRTGGEYRISNFLLWQIAYTEFWFTPTFWPDFNKDEIIKAIDSYKRRERRFGGLKSRIKGLED